MWAMRAAGMPQAEVSEISESPLNWVRRRMMSEDPVLVALRRIEAQMAEGFVSADVRMTQLRVDMMGKLEQVQNELTAIREDLSVAGFAAMRAVKRTDSDREDMQDLNELVNTVLRSLMRLRTDVDELKDRK